MHTNMQPRPCILLLDFLIGSTVCLLHVHRLSSPSVYMCASAKVTLHLANITALRDTVRGLTSGYPFC